MEPSRDILKEMFWSMQISRSLDEAAWRLYRQKSITYHISSIGHEAAQAAAAFAIRRGYDWVTPYYRDLTLLLGLGLSPQDFMLGLMGKQADPSSGGRQMPGFWNQKKAQAISHSGVLAAQALQGVGIGLGIQLRAEDKVVLVSTGEGAASQGDWYEAVNWAAVKKLPVIFFVQNNHYALSLPQEQQMATGSAAGKARGLGLPGHSLDGTDLLAVYQTLCEAVENARRGKGPAIVEAHVSRFTPHSSDDDDRFYRTQSEVENYKKRDPLILARSRLIKDNIFTHLEISELEAKAREAAAQAIQYATNSAYPESQEADQTHVFAQEVPHA